jgi:hypothetical protein
MQLTLLHGYPDFMGKRKAFVGFGAGPVSLPAGGDVIQFPTYGNYIDWVSDGVSIDGLYQVTARPSATGPRAIWALYWAYLTANAVATLAQNVAGTGMTPGTYNIAATGGGGTGATATVVVATATTLGSITITNPGKNYTSAPTFTLAAGGTSATLTSTLSTASGLVATGANLSGSSVQIAGFAGQF